MKKIIIISSIFFLTGLLSCSSVSDVLTNILISDDQEVKLGIQYRQQIEADTGQYPLYTQKTSHSEDLVDYITGIGQKLVAHQNDRTTIDFTFTIINNDEIVNAFAIPGGFIYIYTGLLLKTNSEDEIAGVIAHEIAHVTKRHGAEQLKNEFGMDMLLDVFVGDSNAIRSVFDMSKGLLFLKYGRDNEFEADSCAVEYLTNAGYNPTGMQSFLEVLMGMGGESSRLSILLSTHPDSKDRVERVKTIIDKKSDSVKNRSLTGKKYNP